MNNKLILTSLLAISVASPAMAAFPTDGMMEKDQTYTSAATYENMGVSTSATPAIAAAYYNIDPGYFLPENSYNVTLCTSGNFCPGVSNVTKGSNPQGLYSCSTITSGQYTLSFAGADSKADCYKSCSSGSTGYIYWGELPNCTPSSCNSGYTKVNIAAAEAFDTAYSSYDSSATSEDSSVWKLQNSNGDFLTGRAACKKTSSDRILTMTELSSLDPATGMDSSSCYCWVDTLSTMVGGYRRELSMNGVAVRVSDGCYGNGNSCAVLCAAAARNVNSEAQFGDLILEHATNANKCIPSKYTILYKCTSGGSSVNSQVVEYLANYTPKANTCSKTGYTFDKWAVGNTGTTVSAGTATPWNYTSAQDHVATWTANTITININKNGGSGTCAGSNSKVTCSYDDSCYTPNWNSSSCNLTNSGSVLKGWNTKADGTGTNYALGASIKNIIASGSITLYAVWDTVNCQSGGTGVASLDKLDLTQENKPQCNVTCSTGYSMDGGTPNELTGPYTMRGTAGVGTYKPNCKKNSVLTVTLDSKKYSSSSDNTGASAVKAAAPTQVYLWYGKGWYTDAATSSPISNLTTIPVYYTEEAKIFSGFYDTKGTAVENTDSDYGSRIVSASGAFNNSRNLNYTSNGTLYAGYTACTCTKGNHVKSCTPSGMDSSANKCTYSYTCDSGYHVGSSGTTANGTFSGAANTAANTSPNCSANTITLSWNRNGHGTAPSTPASCTYDGTFTMPAALTATGYTFSNWAVNGKTFNGGQSSVACNYTNLGKYSGTATISAGWSANTIHIVWNGVASSATLPEGGGTLDRTHVSTDGENTARSSVTYDGSIFTPTATVSSEGQSFVGWKFSK